MDEVHFAAVHENNRWRQHKKHETITAAIERHKGAVSLLHNDSSDARKMNAKHGAAIAAFAWLEGDAEAHAFRLDAMGKVEVVRIPVLNITQITGTGSVPSMIQITQWFAHHGPGQRPEEILTRNVSALPLHARAPGDYLYGDKQTWGYALEAVQSLGGAVTAKEVRQQISSQIPSFVLTNVNPDLYAITVNSNSRGNYSGNELPRRSDSGHPMDKLFKLGHGRGSTFMLYDPSLHGVWELADVGDKVLRPRMVEPPAETALRNALAEAAEAGLFDPNEDARKRTLSLIVQREGQPEFRRSLLKAYAGACAISGCRVEALLEAAHIIPYQGEHTNLPENGLLLRADLHKLFDLHLLGIETSLQDVRTVRLSQALKDSEYWQFEGIRLRLPSETRSAPHIAALRHHLSLCSWHGISQDPEE